MVMRPAMRFLALQLVLCGILLAVWYRLGVDDSYIFLTYARNLAKTGIFAFYPGKPSYGFSSPAWVILLAVASRITRIPVGVFLSNSLGVLMCAVSSLAAWAIWDEFDQRPGSNLLFTSILFSGPWFFTVWFIFGMETGLSILAIFGFILWLVKQRADAPRFPWLVLGFTSAALLGLTRLEAGLYIGAAIVLSFYTDNSRRKVIDLFLVGIVAGAAELAWLLYAHAHFGTYMPWTSTARLIYYLPSSFASITGAEYYHLSIVGRVFVAIKACRHIVFGGPMKFLLIVFPLASAGLFLRFPPKPARLQPLIMIASVGIVLEIILFAFFFPLAQNRHLIPYVASLWVLIAPAIASLTERLSKTTRAAAFLMVAALWVAGATLYRREGRGYETLHQIATALHPGDRVTAEPIGIIAFETPIQILDIGGLTDRESWPLLMKSRQVTAQDVISWSLTRGATQIVLHRSECGPDVPVFGTYCLADTQEAHRILRERKMIISAH